MNRAEKIKELLQKTYREQADDSDHHENKNNKICNCCGGHSRGICINYFR